MAAAMCPKCEEERCFYSAYSIKDPSTHISEAGQSSVGLCICALCGAKFIRKCTVQLTEVKAGPVPSWIAKRFKKRNDAALNATGG